MPGLLEGKVAAITAGSTGIGFGIAMAFLAEGATVVLGNRSAEKGALALTRLSAGARASFKKTDVLVRADVDNFIDFTVDEYGTIDVLVNAAGGLDGWARIASLSDETWQNAFDLNCSSAFWATRRALGTMVPNRSGRIINISSVEGKIVTAAGAGHYAMGKHAMNGLTRATAVEYGPLGITCNAICPGPVETELIQQLGQQAADAAGTTYDAFLEGFSRHTLTKQLNTVEQVAGLALLLAGPLGAGITGALLNIDGGMSPF